MERGSIGMPENGEQGQATSSQQQPANAKNMKGSVMNKILLIVIVILVSLFSSCSTKKYTIDQSAKVEKLKYAGVRSSSYGIRPFPNAKKWQQTIANINKRFDSSESCAIWIVGVMNGKRECRLEFPSDKKNSRNIVFLDYDKHEPYLQHFDTTGVKVFLQVEPANADIQQLIDLVLNRYKHHKCVIGFGVDVEWYREADNPNWGVKVGDEQAETWENWVKSHNPQYKLFLKHWDRNWMPPTYRGDLIFVDDSQMLKNFDAMMKEFVEYWAGYFKPNMVFFQYGYPSDRKWWQKLEYPPGDIAIALAQNISQNCGIFWVDFTLEEVTAVRK